MVVIRHRGVRLAVVTTPVRRVWGRATVALVAALAAAWVSVPAAQALSQVTEIAFQANTGSLWTWTLLGGARDTGLGMMPGTSPSVGSGVA